LSIFNPFKGVIIVDVVVVVVVVVETAPLFNKRYI
jgi:hypothetical protein